MPVPHTQTPAELEFLLAKQLMHATSVISHKPFNFSQSQQDLALIKLCLISRRPRQSILVSCSLTTGKASQLLCIYGLQKPSYLPSQSMLGYQPLCSFLNVSSICKRICLQHPERACPCSLTHQQDKLQEHDNTINSTAISLPVSKHMGAP